MPDQVEYYRAYVSFMKRLLLLGGVWPRTGKRSTLYRDVSIVIRFAGLVIVFKAVYCVFTNITDLDRVTRSLSFIGSGLAITLKGSQFFFYEKKVRKVNETLFTLFEEELKNPATKPKLLSLLRFFHRPTYVQFFWTAMLLLLHALTPAFAYQKFREKERLIKNQILPYPGEYPWSLDEETVYWAHLLLEAMHCWFATFLTGGVDTYFNFYMFHMSAILQALASEFRNVKGFGERRNLMRKAVRTYNLLVSCRDAIQTIYGPIILLAAISNGIILCGVMYQMSQPGNMSIDKFLFTLVYTIVKLFQTFTCAWSGHLITSEVCDSEVAQLLHGPFILKSELLQREMYGSGWQEDGDKLYCTSVCFSLMQRPLVVSACSFFNVTVEFFVKIMNMTVSYYFLLQTLEEK